MPAQPVLALRSGTFFGAIASTGDRRKEAVIDWARILAYVTGTVDQELLAQNEYLAAENRILKDQLKGRLMLSQAEPRSARLVIAWVARFSPRSQPSLGRTRSWPGTASWSPVNSLARGLVSPGRPRLKREVEQLIIRIASENRDLGYDWIAGAMANLGDVISDQTVGNGLRRKSETQTRTY
jgi:putative transposase